MKAIDLDSLSYKHRFNGASFLISKANKLAGMGQPLAAIDPQKGLAALAYYDMALALIKPFDPNYSTALNWKCNVLRALGQYEDAVEWYREIIPISDETDGKAKRNATAALAEEMIQACAGRKNEPLEVNDADAALFDDPPFCMHAEKFCRWLNEGKFSKAHQLLSPALKETFPVPALKAAWQTMTGHSKPEDISLALEQHAVDWPDRKPDEIGWCYFSVSTAESSEAVTVVIGGKDHALLITALEFGRP